MNEIDITIVTPSYNYAKYIRECVESVVAQKGISYEHIVFDACSDDGSIEILKEYDQLDLTVEKDSGMTEAINKGFKKAKGKWVMWLNTDDRLLEGALKAFMEFADKHDDADVIHGGWNFIDGDGSIISQANSMPFYLNMLVHSGVYLGSTATFYRRSSIIEEGHYLNENFKYVMDGEHYTRLAAIGKKFVYFPKVLADFRMHGDNLSMGFGNVKDASDNLRRQQMIAESIAIRRTYGITLFKTPHLNAAADCILHYFFKVLKQPVKWCHRAKIIYSNEKTD